MGPPPPGGSAASRACWLISFTCDRCEAPESKHAKKCSFLAIFGFFFDTKPVKKAFPPRQRRRNFFFHSRARTPPPAPRKRGPSGWLFPSRRQRTPHEPVPDSFPRMFQSKFSKTNPKPRFLLFLITICISTSPLWNAGMEKSPHCSSIFRSANRGFLSATPSPGFHPAPQAPPSLLRPTKIFLGVTPPGFFLRTAATPPAGDEGSFDPTPRGVRFRERGSAGGGGATLPSIK